MVSMLLSKSKVEGSIPIHCQNFIMFCLLFLLFFFMGAKITPFNRESNPINIPHYPFTHTRGQNIALFSLKSSHFSSSNKLKDHKHITISRNVLEKR